MNISKVKRVSCVSNIRNYKEDKDCKRHFNNQSSNNDKGNGAFDKLLKEETRKLTRG